MEIMTKQQQALAMRVLCVLAGILVVGWLAGTFCDLQVDQAIYAPDNTLVIAWSALGLIPLVLPMCLFLGVLLQRCWEGAQGVMRFVGSAVSIILALVSGVLGMRSLLEADGIGKLLPFKVPSAGWIVCGVLMCIVLMAVGFRAGRRNEEAELAKRVIVVVVALALSFIVVEIIKNFMCRPRYRTLVLGHEGVEFAPWYKRTSGTKELIAQFGLPSDAFKSFPSGHSLQVGVIFASFYGLCLLYPSLREKWNVALVLQIVIMFSVMACRMVLGAHFLSDVSVGALIGVVADIVVLRRLASA